MPAGPDAPRRPTRREPPPFRPARVVRTSMRTERLVRVTLGGPALAGLPEGLPAASVRILLPRDSGLELPTWNGNEFLLADGTRPAIRTLTPRRTEAAGAAPELDVEVVLHGEGRLATWAATAGPRDEVAVSGTGRGYEIDPAARELVLAGDESALPAIQVIFEALPSELAVRVLVEVADPSARLDLPGPPGTSVTWCEARPAAAPGAGVVAAVEALGVDPGVRVWAAGEAAAVQRLRRHLTEDRGLPRSDLVVRGYWKHGRTGT